MRYFMDENSQTETVETRIVESFRQACSIIAGVEDVIQKRGGMMTEVRVVVLLTPYDWEMFCVQSNNYSECIKQAEKVGVFEKKTTPQTFPIVMSPMKLRWWVW